MTEKGPLLHVYGDESISLGTVVYGVLAVSEPDVASLQQTLQDLKTAFGGSVEDDLHCRELFAGDARSKSPWAHLAIADVFRLYRSLAENISGKVCRRLVVACDMSTMSKRIPADDWVPEMHYGPKELAALCANAAMIPFFRSPGRERIKFWADPDETKIGWLGKRRKAINALNMFIDEPRSREVEPERVKVEPISGKKPELLQLADFLAYVSARAISKRKRSHQAEFVSIYKELNPERLELTRTTDGGFVIRVPNSLLQGN